MSRQRPDERFWWLCWNKRINNREQPRSESATSCGYHSAFLLRKNHCSVTSNLSFPFLRRLWHVGRYSVGLNSLFWQGIAVITVRCHARVEWQQSKHRNKEEVDFDGKLWVFRLNRLWCGMLGFGLSASWHLLGTLVWHHVSPEQMSLFRQAWRDAVPLNYGQ